MAAVQQLSPAWPLGARITDGGRIEVGGCDLADLARQVGTPAYVVAEDDLRARARAFVEAFRARTDRFDVHFASKAFPCTAVYRVLAEEGIGCDVAGAGELMSALKGGFDPQKVLVHGNAKSIAELELCVDTGVGLIVVDNLDELGRLSAVLERAGEEQAILLRVAPGVSPDTHPGISTGGPNTKFGLNLEDAKRAVEHADRDPRLHLHGLHFHIGSQILELEPFRAALQRVVGALGDHHDVWNLGGGLGVSYGHSGGEPPTIEAYVDAKVRMVEELVGPGRKIIDEPGRSLTANSTVTLYEVQSVKRNVVTWVGVDGGMSDNLRPMLYGAHYECQVADRVGTGTVANVTGKHCESSDVVVFDAELNDPRVGDVLVTPTTGAYGYAMASNYNGALRPPVVFVKDGEHRVVVRRETYEDLLSRDA